MAWRYEFEDFAGGVGAVAFGDGDKYAYMLAYTSDTEYLVLMKDPYLSMPHYAGYPLVYNIQ